MELSQYTFQKPLSESVQTRLDTASSLLSNKLADRKNQQQTYTYTASEPNNFIPEITMKQYTALSNYKAVRDDIVCGYETVRDAAGYLSNASDKIAELLGSISDFHGDNLTAAQKTDIVSKVNTINSEISDELDNLNSLSGSVRTGDSESVSLNIPNVTLSSLGLSDISGTDIDTYNELADVISNYATAAIDINTKVQEVSISTNILDNVMQQNTDNLNLTQYGINRINSLDEAVAVSENLHSQISDTLSNMSYYSLDKNIVGDVLANLAH